MTPPSHLPFLLIVLLLFLLLPPRPLRSPCFCSALSPDGLTLLAFKSAVSADPSSTLAGWDEDDDDPCRWPGVSCANVSGYAYPRVVALSVADKNLSGYIPSELGSLVFLRRLNLHGNLLSGPIPPHLSNATSLHSLFLYANNLSGTFPPSLCNLPRLQNLDLSRNALSGPIPAELRDCHQLQRLLLSGNRLSGEVPAGIWSELGGLVQLDLSSNGLSGGIPPDLGDLALLSETVNLSHNQFSGEIPSNLGKLPPAVTLDLRGNNLSGKIPQVGALSSQGPSAFLGNPNLCGFPLPNTCRDASPAAPAGGLQGNPTGSPVGGGKRARKGLSLGKIVLIAVADAVGVALIGLVLVFAYWKLKDGGGGCSCTGKTKLGGSDGGAARPGPCCWGKRSSCGCGGSASSCCSEEDGEESSDGGGGEEGGDLVAMDKGFELELEELLRASAYVLGKSGLGIVYKVVVGNGVPVAVRRLGEGGGQRRKEFAAEARAVGRVRHPNVVRLRAFYWAPDEKLLISDFVSNGSLAAALRGEGRCVGLPRTSCSPCGDVAQPGRPSWHGPSQPMGPSPSHLLKSIHRSSGGQLRPSHRAPQPPFPGPHPLRTHLLPPPAPSAPDRCRLPHRFSSASTPPTAAGAAAGGGHSLPAAAGPTPETPALIGRELISSLLFFSSSSSGSLCVTVDAWLSSPHD